MSFSHSRSVLGPTMTEINILCLDRGREVRFGPNSPFDGTKIPFEIFGIVEICETPTGTSIRWDIDCVSRESIEAVYRSLGKYRTPYILNYAKLGWVTEVVLDAAHARQRIYELMGLRGLETSKTVMRWPADRDTFNDLAPGNLSRPTAALLSRSVVSSFDENSGICPLQYAGKDSLMRHLKTLDWFRPQNEEFPTPNIAFERQISEDYQQILSSGTGRVDNFLAVVQPKLQTEQRWIAYTRIAAPIMHEGKYCVIALCIPTTVNLNAMEWKPTASADRVQQLKS